MFNNPRIFFLSAILFGALIFPSINNVFANTGESDYNPVEVRNEMNFTAVLNADGKVEMSWDEYAPSGFTYYKIVRSTENANPVYPDDGYIEYSSEADFTATKDSNPPDGTVYYRICSIVDRDRFCSQVVKVIVSSTNDTEGEVESSKDFADIEGNAYAEAIISLRAKEIVQGFLEGNRVLFRPELSINRAEFLKVLLEAKYADKLANYENSSDCFSDIKTAVGGIPAWYVRYACFAKEKGIIGGYPDGSLRAGNTINLAEAAKILVKLYGLGEAKAEVGEWYLPYVRALQDENYIPLSVLRENSSLTRGEMAELIWRIENRIRNKTSSRILLERETEAKMEAELETKTEVKTDAEIGAETASDDYPGWQKFNGEGYSFYYPGDWFTGVKRGWNYFSEEEDYILNLTTPYYLDVDTYVTTYNVAVDKGLSDEVALRTKVVAAHPEISAEFLNINGMKALKRSLRAPEGTEVNGRITGENENIILYTYRDGGIVHVLYFFSAFSNEDYGVENFNKIAGSLRSGN